MTQKMYKFAKDEISMLYYRELITKDEQKELELALLQRYIDEEEIPQ
jgi:hypothetical protein